MKEKIKIQNGLTETILSFNTKEQCQAMVDAINKCLEDEGKYPTLTYRDKEGSVIFTATYLKNSLIFIPVNHDN